MQIFPLQLRLEEVGLVAGEAGVETLVEQSLPEKPALHVHTPVFEQTPWPEQPLGHETALRTQSVPEATKPSRQLQEPAAHLLFAGQITFSQRSCWVVVVGPTTDVIFTEQSSPA